jgi:hypothetical protein
VITPKESIEELMTSIAESLVLRHNLRTVEGEIVCWNCKGRLALMPHLHCRYCYEDWKRRSGR